MAETRTTWADLLTQYADNTAGAISAEDLRDLVQSVRPHEEAGDPTTSDDETDGFDVGHYWLNSSDASLWVCRNAATGSADWVKVYPQDSGGAEELDDLSDVDTSDASEGDVLALQSGVWAPTTAGSGDMTKAVYDTDDNGKVDVAERVEETVATDSDSGSAHAIDCGSGTVHQVTLTANCTLSFTNVPSGGFGITLELIQDATGSRTVTWPAAVTWAGGTAPTLSTAASGVDVVALYTPDGGTTWRGALVGLAFS